MNSDTKNIISIVFIAFVSSALWSASFIFYFAAQQPSYSFGPRSIKGSGIWVMENATGNVRLCRFAKINEFEAELMKREREAKYGMFADLVDEAQKEDKEGLLRKDNSPTGLAMEKWIKAFDAVSKHIPPWKAQCFQPTLYGAIEEL